MTKKRVTPEEDYERLAQNLLLNAPGIKDRNSYDAAIREYMGDDAANKVEEDTWPYVKGIISGRLFRRAGGKDLAADKAHLAKEVVETEAEYVKKRSQRVDKLGVDTPDARTAAQRHAIRARIKRKVTHTYTYPGRQAGKVVYARKILTARGPRYINSAGRYVSIKRP